MRGALIVVATVAAISGCGTSAPISFVTTSPSPSDASFACVSRKLNELSYTVTNASKDAGFITGERQNSGATAEILTGMKSHDVITVSIFDDAGGALRKIRATAGQTVEKASLFANASKSSAAPSEKGIADAKAILTTCGSGAITERTSTFQARLEVSAGAH